MKSQACWHMPIMPVLEKQRKESLGLLASCADKLISSRFDERYGLQSKAVSDWETWKHLWLPHTCMHMHTHHTDMHTEMIKAFLMRQVLLPNTSTVKYSKAPNQKYLVSSISLKTNKCTAVWVGCPGPFDSGGAPQTARKAAPQTKWGPFHLSVISSVTCLTVR